LNAVSVHELRRELARRQRDLTSLHRRRSSVMEKLKALDAQIASLGGSIGTGPDGVRRRPRNEKNLVAALVEALTDKTMSVTEVAEDVQRRGYVTTSPSFRTIVNQTLINSGKFKRVGRGLYTAK
jgi:septal ring factor EnvC (AmiA/AmiB activator)